jgi:hypothetical protein
VVADGKMMIDVIPRRALEELMQADPVLASHVYHSLAVLLAERLRYRTDDLVVPSFNSG